jgi:hypothetical protein
MYPLMNARTKAMEMRIFLTSADPRAEEAVL